MSTTEGIGATMAVSATAPATLDATGYAALTWIEIGELSEIPEFGASHDVVTFTNLKTGIVNKFHGALNYGSITLPMAESPGDAGQAALDAARRSKDEIYFRETDSAGAVRYFPGKVMSFTKGASIGNVVPRNANVEITGETVEVPV